MDGVEVHHAPRAPSSRSPTKDYISRTTDILSPSRPPKHINSSVSPLKDDNQSKIHPAPANTTKSSTEQPSVVVLSGLKERPQQPKSRVSEYHTRLRYQLNDTANGQWVPLPSETSFPLASLSVPNTFKNRLYPNAKTTNEIGIWHDINEEHKPDDPQSKDEVAKAPRSNDTDDTPSWMPSLLQEKWPASNLDELSCNTQPAGSDSSVKRLSKVAQSTGNFDDVLESSSAHTMIHNSDYAEHEEPAWKHANGAYEAHRDAKFDFRNIFLSLNSDERNAFRSQRKPHQSNTTEAQSQTSLADVPESNLPHYDDTSFTPTNVQPQMTPGVFRNLDSPLKLFKGDRYNTYTKDTLSDLLKKVGCAQKQQPVAEAIVRAVEANSEVADVSLKENLSVRKGVDSPGKQTAQQQFASKADYLKNAEDVYAKLLQNPLNGTAMSKPPSFCRSTSTSTPLKKKLSKSSIDPNEKRTDGFRDESVSSGFDEFTVTSIGDNERGQARTNNPLVNHSHTFETVSEPIDAGAHTVPRIVEPYGTSLYTFDETEDDRLPALASRHDSPQSENTYSTVSEVATAATPLRVKNSPRKALGVISNNYSPRIKWKTVSQLKRSNPPSSLPSSARATKPQRGQVHPDQYQAASFDRMVYDEENHRWVLRAHEDSDRGSLDSIEDLQSDTFLRRHKEPSNDQHDESQAQVSFQIPHLAIKPVLDNCLVDANDAAQLASVDDMSEPANVGNVTQVADLGDVTFLESQRQMVGIVTDALERNDDMVDWNVVSDIDLQGRAINSVRLLNRMLPNLLSINLANNAIEFIEGLPAEVCDLDLSSNKISNMTLFSQHRSTTRLNVSHNKLTSILNLGHNISLACLDASHNFVTSFRGIEGLHNLTELNLSSNEITGPVSFHHCHLPHLTKLDLSHNQISEINGLESLSSLRILDLAHNLLKSLDVTTSLPKMRKLLLQGNRIEKLNVSKVSQLRVLRIDSVFPVEVIGLKSLCHLEELSCRGEGSSAESVLLEIDTVQKLDLSGLLISSFPTNKQCMSVTNLNLSACNLESIPQDLCRVFPNVRKLNLNFNRLHDIGRLSGFKFLENLSVVSNCIDKFSTLVMGVSGVRKTLRVLDVRLNPLTFNIHAWVFDPLESFAIRNMLANGQGPIQLDKYDDIDLFLVNYASLKRDVAKWELRDREFYRALEKSDPEALRRRQQFEATILTTYRALQMLNGNIVTQSVQVAAKAAWQDLSRLS